ncbi:LAFA_0E10682g1_1 [Lachancea sp. 'fantastica']|nr:LAFA_0E10682g1_1 [Lachancea sp. 'fantastica']
MELRRSTRRKTAVKCQVIEPPAPAHTTITRRSRRVKEVVRPQVRKRGPAIRLCRPQFRGPERQHEPVQKKSTNTSANYLVDRETVRSCLDTFERMAEQTDINDERQSVSGLSQQLRNFIEAIEEFAVKEKSDNASLLDRIKSEAKMPKVTSPASKADLLLTKILVDKRVTDPEGLAVVAKWHGIDTQDVADITFNREKGRPKLDHNAQYRFDQQCVNKRVNRLLLLERNSSLGWPERKRKIPSTVPASGVGESYSEVALMS